LAKIPSIDLSTRGVLTRSFPPPLCMYSVAGALTDLANAALLRDQGASHPLPQHIANLPKVRRKNNNTLLPMYVYFQVEENCNFSPGAGGAEEKPPTFPHETLTLSLSPPHILSFP
jgi:hypothetical protein